MFISNSINLSGHDIDYRYKAAINYFYKILAVLYLEKTGILQGYKLHRQIDFIQTENNSGIFYTIFSAQLSLINYDDFFFQDYNLEIKIRDEYFPNFMKVLKKISAYNDLNVETFGYLYEYFQQYKLVQNSINELDPVQLTLNISKPSYDYVIILSDSDKKEQGSFFTPSELIERIINSGLTEKVKNINSLNDLLSIKVLDPACGGGNILVRVFEQLYDTAIRKINSRINKNDIKRLILKSCIYGIDIDSFACEVTKLSLFLASNSTGHIENIICGNFLIEDMDEYPYNVDISRLFRNNKSKFSLIIGNPPYLNIENISEQEKKYYLENYESAYRRFDIYLLFIEKSLKYLLRNRGILSFIVPDKLLSQSYSKKLRQLILENHTIKEIICYKDQNMFKNAVVIPTIITIEAGKSGDSMATTIEILSDEEKVNTIDQNIYKSLYNFNFRIGWNNYKQEIIEQIQAKSFPLHELCYVSWGAQPGDAKKFIFNNVNLVQPEYKKYLKPLIRGGNLDRYSISYSGDYLLYLTEGENKLHRPAFKELFDSEKIVVAEVTATKGIIASFDDRKYYTNHSVINCIHKKDLINVDPSVLSARGIKISDEIEEIKTYKWQEDQLAYTKGCQVNKKSRFNNVNIKYALGILNSSLINFYYKNLLSGDLNVFPELVRFLPVYDITGTSLKKSNSSYYKALIDKNDFEKIDELLEDLVENSNYSGINYLFSLIVDQIILMKKNNNQAGCTALDEILDNAVYHLYGLDQDQITIVKEDL